MPNGLLRPNTGNRDKPLTANQDKPLKSALKKPTKKGSDPKDLDKALLKSSTGNGDNPLTANLETPLKSALKKPTKKGSDPKDLNKELLKSSTRNRDNPLTVNRVRPFTGNRGRPFTANQDKPLKSALKKPTKKGSDPKDLDKGLHKSSAGNRDNPVTLNRGRSFTANQDKPLKSALKKPTKKGSDPKDLDKGSHQVKSEEYVGALVKKIDCLPINKEIQQTKKKRKKEKKNAPQGLEMKVNKNIRMMCKMYYHKSALVVAKIREQCPPLLWSLVFVFGLLLHLTVHLYFLEYEPLYSNIRTLLRIKDPPQPILYRWFGNVVSFIKRWYHYVSNTIQRLFETFPYY